MDVRTDQAGDPWTEGAEGRDPAAARVERRYRPGRARFGHFDGAFQRLVDQAPDGGLDPQPGQQGESPGFGHPHQAVEVTASVMPCASSQRSASIAALQPSAAAVTAWR